MNSANRFERSSHESAIQNFGPISSSDKSLALELDRAELEFAVVNYDSGAGSDVYCMQPDDKRGVNEMERFRSRTVVHGASA